MGLVGFGLVGWWRDLRARDARPYGGWMQNCPIVWIIIGVAGSGKTLIGRMLAAQLECDFLEGDRRHPTGNIAKMLAQEPLTDADRAAWLQTMTAEIQRSVDRKCETVLTCSGLKRAYREQLRVSDRVQLVSIDVPESELQRRLECRGEHYMKPEMLRSQLVAFEAIEPSENVMVVDGMAAPEAIVAAIFQQSQARFEGFDRPWWERV
jgi:gluconokinase